MAASAAENRGWRVSASASERVRELFAGAVELEGAERERFLERECTDEAVRAEVRALLDEPVEAGFLGEPLVAPDFLERLEAAPGPPRPRQVGPYRIIGELGEGGAGAVYLAEQDGPVRRTVALKLLHPGANTRRMMARFRAEGRALAAMDHPHIARLYDVRTAEDGRLCFVMEHVRGEPVTRFCAERLLSMEQRLRLLIMACGAVQHAHGKGILHRDLKPSNVLASEGSGAEGPTLKVIDFGVAKIAAPEDEASMATEHGAILGTLAYMSPEQIDGRADARSDVYSLGVLAYEVLTGRLPIEVRGAPLSEAIRKVREQPPAPVGRVLRGDAEAILAMALAKDPARRYASADALGADLQRLARGEPVLARGSGAPYLLATMARRHKRAAAGIVAGLIVLVGALGLATAGLVRARIAERRSAQAEGRTVEALTFTARQAMAALDGRFSIRAVRTALAARLDTDSAAMLEARPDDLAVIELRTEVLREQARLLYDATEYRGCLALRQEVRALRERALEQRPRDPDITAAYSIDLVLIGDALGKLGDARGQREQYERAEAMQERLVAKHGRRSDQSLLVWSFMRLAARDFGEHRIDSGVARAEACLRLTEALLQSDPTDLATLDCAQQAHGLLVGTLRELGDEAGGRLHFEAQQELAERLFRADPSNRMYAQSYLRALGLRARASDAETAAVLEREGFERAQRMLVLDPGDWEAMALTTSFAMRLARAAAKAGNADKARAMVGVAVELVEGIPGSSPDTEALRGSIYEAAADVLTEVGDAAGAADMAAKNAGSPR